MKLKSLLVPFIALAFICVPFTTESHARKTHIEKVKPVSAIPEIQNLSFDFEEVDAGAVPAGWMIEETGQAKSPAIWEIMEEIAPPSGKKTLSVTTAENTGEAFNICWTKNIVFQSGEISARMKPVKGVEDQGGGIIWRVQDRNNYYIARYNPLEKNFRLYVVEGGRRKILASAKIEPLTEEWATIKIVHIGTHIEAFLNGNNTLIINDNTFNGPGGVGFWTKADAISSFDDLALNKYKEEPVKEEKDKVRKTKNKKAKAVKVKKVVKKTKGKKKKTKGEEA